jgi:regulator of replication initiation timing
MENMTDLIISGLIIVAEVALGFGVLLIIIVATSIIRRRHKSLLADNLIDHLQINVQSRMQQLRQEVQDSIVCDQQDIEDRLEALYEKEKRLYEHILAIYQKGTPGLLEGVSQDVDALLTASRDLFKSGKSNNKKTVESMIKRQSVLEKENHQLKEALVSLKHELLQVQTEFSAMYARDN